MQRYRWYELQLPIEFDQFVEKIERLRLSTRSLVGFLKLESPRGESRFNFIWTTYLSSVSLHRDGSSKTEQIPTLSMCEVSLFKAKGRVWLRVLDPARSAKELLDSLERVGGFGFSATSVSLFGGNRTSFIPKGSEGRLISFKALRALPNESAVARIEAASKQGLDLGTFSLLGDGNYALEQLTYEIVYRQAKGQLTITNSGIVKVSGQLAPFLVDSVESTLVTSA